MPAPVIYATTPKAVPATVGNRVVQLVGRNFDAATTVTFAGTAATVTEVVSQFLLQAAPANHAAGAADIIVTNGTGPTTVVGGLTYV